MKFRSFLILNGTLPFLFVLFICTSLIAKDVGTVWPKVNWPVSSPEKQGLDSKQIGKIIAKVSKKSNLLIIRNGYIVAEYYKNENKRQFAPNIYSCTKGVVSALIGHAIELGYIKDVHQNIIDYFPELDHSKFDRRKSDITVYHLLTMSSGLQGIEGFAEFNQIYLQPDWGTYILSKKMVSDPGTAFNYNSLHAHLLSVILQRATKMTAYEYANQHLFNPLNISIISWEQNLQKENIGGWGIRMSMSDIAKFGYLYLHEGRWGNNQIIPSEWIKESTKQHMSQSGDWSGWGYGYNWNILPDVPQFTYSLVGGGGQFRVLITAIPTLDIVAVYAGPLFHNQVFDLYRKHLYSAVTPAN